MKEFFLGTCKRLGKQRIIYIATVVFSILFLIIGSRICKSDLIGNGESDCYKAEVTEIISVDDTQYDLKECKLVNNLVIPIKITFDQVISLLEAYCRTSLVVQWLRIHLPMQDTRVSFLFWKDSTCVGVNKPVDHNY